MADPTPETVSVDGRTYEKRGAAWYCVRSSTSSAPYLVINTPTTQQLLDALASRDAELARAREEIAALKEGFDAEGFTAAERCCSVVKAQLASENESLRAALAEREDVRPLLESASNRLGIFARAFASSVAPAGFTEATMVLGVKRDLDSYLSHHDPAAAVRSPEEDRTDG